MYWLSDLSWEKGVFYYFVCLCVCVILMELIGGCCWEPKIL